MRWFIRILDARIGSPCSSFTDLRVGATLSRVSLTDADGQTNGHSFDGAVSDNGRYVAFTSRAANLIAGPSSGHDQIFIRDTVAGTTKIVSAPTGTIQGDGDSSSADISANGRYVVFSSEADNLVDGGGAGDLLRGMGGNDTYLVYASATTIVEAGGQGTADRVLAAVNYKLGAGVSVEQLSTTSSTGTPGINLTGNEFVQKIVGNAGVNILDGKGGGDTLKGLAGKDTLTGGAGKDNFVFSTALNAATNVDTIKDFSIADDTIQLDDAIFTALAKTGALLSGYFRANATGMAQDANDHIVYETTPENSSTTRTPLVSAQVSSSRC